MNLKRKKHLQFEIKNYVDHLEWDMSCDLEFPSEVSTV
jgi:hypothetical protein